MNFSSLLGILSGLGIIGYAVLDSGKHSDVYLNPHSLAIVLGGTLAAALVSFRAKTLFNLSIVFLRHIFGLRPDSRQHVIEDAVMLAQGHRADPQFMANNTKRVRHPFFREAAELLVQGGIKGAHLDVILKRRALTYFKRYEEQAEIFRVIARFPPAFGLLGTTVGMISLMQSLGGSNNSQVIGQSMAIGLTATFYGIAIANFIFIPMSEHLMKMTRDDETVREMVIDAVRMLREQQHPVIVEEHLKSFLIPSERSNKKIAS